MKKFDLIWIHNSKKSNTYNFNVKHTDKFFINQKLRILSPIFLLKNKMNSFFSFFKCLNSSRFIILNLLNLQKRKIWVYHDYFSLIRVENYNFYFINFEININNKRKKKKYYIIITLYSFSSEIATKISEFKINISILS